MHPPLAESLKSLYDEVLIGRAHLTIAQGLAKCHNEDPPITNVAPAFFGLSITAHLEAAQLYAAKLFEKNSKESLSLVSMLEHIENTPSILTGVSEERALEIVQSCRALISGVVDRLTPLRVRRDKILAHLDRETVTDPAKITVRAELYFKDLERFFQVAAVGVSRISGRQLFDDEQVRLMNESDYEQAIRRIGEAKHAEAAKYEHEFGVPCDWPLPKAGRTS